MKDQRKRDAIEQLVADYLEQEAAATDVRKLIERVETTRRRRRFWRRTRLIAATAALFIVAVGLGLLLTSEAPQTPKPPTDAIIRTVVQHGSRARRGMSALRSGVSPFATALDDLPLGMDGTAALVQPPDLAGLRGTLIEDVGTVGAELGSSLKMSLSRAGLYL